MTTAQQLTSLALKCREERAARWKIEESEAFKEIESQIATSMEYLAGLQEEKQMLLNVVPDSSPDLEALKREMIAEMKEQGIERMENVLGKWRVSKNVNTRKLMDFLQGDLDNFFILAKVSQKDLKEFEKENDAYKGASKECIEETGKELVDISIELPE